jgi:hypothetical protein
LHTDNYATSDFKVKNRGVVVNDDVLVESEIGSLELAAGEIDF